jgi:hypothetical protein
VGCPTYITFYLFIFISPYPCVHLCPRVISLLVMLETWSPNFIVLCWHFHLTHLRVFLTLVLISLNPSYTSINSVIITLYKKKRVRESEKATAIKSQTLFFFLSHRILNQNTKKYKVHHEPQEHDEHENPVKLKIHYHTISVSDLSQ